MEREEYPLKNAVFFGKVGREVPGARGTGRHKGFARSGRRGAHHGRPAGAVDIWDRDIRSNSQIARIVDKGTVPRPAIGENSIGSWSDRVFARVRPDRLSQIGSTEGRDRPVIAFWGNLNTCHAQFHDA